MMTFWRFQSAPSISHWKEAGHPSNPMGEVIQWNCSLPGIVKAVKGWYFLSNFICQNPEVRSKVDKILEFARPMSPMHSVISFMEYLSMCEFSLSSRKSCTIRSPCPCSLGTQNIGELYRESDLRTTPSFNYSSRVCSMNWWWASVILNCFRYTGSSFLRWILCL